MSKDLIIGTGSIVPDCKLGMRRNERERGDWMKHTLRVI